jgi:hypothetical protein
MRVMAKRKIGRVATIPVVTIAQAAASIGISVKSVHRHAEAGALGEVYTNEQGATVLANVSVAKFMNRLELDFGPAATRGRPSLGDRRKTPAQRKAAWQQRQQQQQEN